MGNQAQGTTCKTIEGGAVTTVYPVALERVGLWNRTRKWGTDKADANFTKVWRQHTYEESQSGTLGTAPPRKVCRAVESKLFRWWNSKNYDTVTFASHYLTDRKSDEICCQPIFAPKRDIWQQFRLLRRWARSRILLSTEPSQSQRCQVLFFCPSV